MPAASSFNRTITGTSDVSVDDAIARTLTVARDGYGEPDWFDVVTARGFISNGQVTHYQVTLKLGYEAASKAADAEDVPRATITPSKHGFDLRCQAGLPPVLGVCHNWIPHIPA